MKISSGGNTQEYHPELLGSFKYQEFSIFGSSIYQYKKGRYKLIGGPGQAWGVSK